MFDLNNCGELAVPTSLFTDTAQPCSAPRPQVLRDRRPIPGALGSELDHLALEVVGAVLVRSVIDQEVPAMFRFVFFHQHSGGGPPPSPFMAGRRGSYSSSTLHSVLPLATPRRPTRRMRGQKLCERATTLAAHNNRHKC